MILEYLWKNANILHKESLMAEGKKIEIKPARDLPMLAWVGKRPQSHVTTFLAEQVELFTPSQSEICNLQSSIGKIGVRWWIV